MAGRLSWGIGQEAEREDSFTQIARVSYGWWKIQSIIRRQSTSEGDTISLAGQWRMVICVWRRSRVQRTRHTCWRNVLMLGNWGYAKPQLVFCSCCYRCCGAVKMLMMKRFSLRMYFLDDWISLHDQKILPLGDLFSHPKKTFSTKSLHHQHLYRTATSIPTIT